MLAAVHAIVDNTDVSRNVMVSEYNIRTVPAFAPKPDYDGVGDSYGFSPKGSLEEGSNLGMLFRMTILGREGWV